MTDSNWKRVFELYEAASLLAPKDAEAFLNRLSDDPRIVREVRALILGLDSAIAAEPDTDEPEQDRAPQEPEEDRSRTGTRLGRYEVLERIGRGATAEVYAGRDTVLNRPVALKFLSAGSSSIMPSMMRRFLREAQAASALNHPNIVTIHEIIESAGSDAPVMVMELVEGQALRQLCGNPMRESRASRIIAQVALALDAAHAKGLVHRDLKPENIMVRHDGYVKILDFGLVKRLFQEGSSLEDNLTSMAGLPVGTLRYMSPEQCRGEQATSASDIFALGIIMHELVAGSHPFVRGDGSGGAFDVAHAIANSDPKALTGTTTGYRDLVTRALSKDPKARPSAAEAAKMLGAPPPGDTTQVRIRAVPPPQSSTAGNGSASNRRRILQIAGGSLVAAAGAGLYFFTRKPRQTQTSSPADLTASRILIQDGNASDPAFSPDGSTLAFAWIPPGATDSHIYLVRDDGAPPTQLTFSGGSEREPCWSPDGSKIAFVRQGVGESAFYVISPRGGPERRIATNPVPQVVGFLSWLSNRVLLMREAGNGTSHLVKFDLETGAKEQITFPPPALSDGTPLASPDRQSIAFLRTTSDTTLDLYILPANAPPRSEARRLTFDEHAKREFCWTPDSAGIVYHTLDSYYYIPAQGGAPRKVPTLQSFNGSFTLRAAGRKGILEAAAVRNRRGDSIWRASLSSPGAETPVPTRFISSGSGSVDVDPALSPDGRQLAFLSIRSNSVEIWLTDIFGGNPTQLSSMGGPELYAPSWSPNGKYVVSAGRFDGYNNIFRISTTGGANPEILYRSLQPLSLPAYSPDGRWITFTAPADNTDQLFRIPASGSGQPERLTREGGQVHQHSPDGEWIYFSHRRSPGLWRMPSKGGPAELVLDSVIPFLNRAWKVVPSGAIYFAAQDPGSSKVEIRRYVPRARKVERILVTANPFPRWHDAICVGPNEQWLLFPQREAAVAQLILAEDIPIPGA